MVCPARVSIQCNEENKAVWPFSLLLQRDPCACNQLSCHEPVPTLHLVVSSPQVKPHHQSTQTNAPDDHIQTNPNIPHNILYEIRIDLPKHKQQHSSPPAPQTKEYSSKRTSLAPPISQVKPRHQPAHQHRHAHKHQAHPNIAKISSAKSLLTLPNRMIGR